MTLSTKVSLAVFLATLPTRKLNSLCEIKLTSTEAANDLAKTREAFIQNVKTSMRGGSVRGERFDKVIIGA